MPSLQLNDEQRRAVEHGTGPLLIVAGAGTGKTCVLIERIGYLLRTVKGLKPENILALTFSRKAAAEMRQRAPGKASEVPFSTFHSFCNKLISEETQSRPVDKIDQWIFLRRNLEKLDLDHYFKVSDPGRFLSDLVDFASRCHDNLVTWSDYEQYVEDLARRGEERLVADPELAAKRAPKGRGKAKQRDLAIAFKEEIDRQREVARVYRVMETLQEDHTYLSYGAMISSAVRLLKARPELLRELQRKYYYILVDEFQDTNAAQLELVGLLAGERRNITVVGDDDQAIYRFRGASYGSFKQFEKKFPDYVKVFLQSNYRSTPEVLEAARIAISRNPGRESKLPLIPQRPSGPQVKVWEFADEADSAVYAANHLYSLLAGLSDVRPAEKSDTPSVAVLYRSHAHRELLVAALRTRNIPFAIRGLAIDSLPVIRDLVTFLRVIGDSRDGVSLARVLRSFCKGPQWVMTEKEFIECCERTRRKTENGLRTDLWHAVIEKHWQGGDDFRKFVARCRQRAGDVRLEAWLPLLIDELGLPRSESEEEALQIFRRFVGAWNRDKTENGLLSDFLEYLEYFEQAGGRIERPEYEDGDSQSENTSDPAAQPVVQLMTAHAAKGMEFDHVIVWQLLRYAFPVRNRKPLIVLPDELWTDKDLLPKGDFHLEEERRLFYVALTRARRTLTMVTAANENKVPSRFLDDFGPDAASNVAWVYPIVTTQMRGEDTTRNLAADIPLGIKPQREETGPFSLSISQLETYLECPLKYYFSYALGVPIPYAPAMLFGTAMHAAVGGILREVCTNKRLLSDAEVEAIFNSHWTQWDFSDAVQEAKYREKGLKELRQLRDAWWGRPVKLLYQERKFRIKLGGVPVAGRIDLVYRNERDEVELLDFKTGRPKAQKEADEMRQLTLYAEACRRELGLRAQSIALYNFTGNELLHTTRSDDDLNQLEGEIHETQQRIAAGSFPAHRGFMTCRNCAYRSICPAHEQRLD